MKFFLEIKQCESGANKSHAMGKIISQSMDTDNPPSKYGLVINSSLVGQESVLAEMSLKEKFLTHSK